MNSLLSVIKFTFLNRIRTKSFLVTSLILLIVLSIGINLPSLISSFSSGKADKVGVWDRPSEVISGLEAYFGAQEKPSIELVKIPDQGSAAANDRLIKERIEAKEIKGFLELTEDKAAGFPKATYKSAGSFMENGVTGDLAPALQAVKQAQLLKGAGLTAEQLAKLNAPVDLTSIQVDNGDGRTRSQMIVSYILVYALLILVSMMVYMYGNMIAMEITSEKSSRVMELLVSSISPVKQLYGKVLGTLLIGLLQIGVYVLVVVINLNLPHNASYFKGIDLDFGDAPPQLYGYFVLFFLLGFFLYAMLCAAVGSLVSRTEELGQAIAPITILALAGFYIGMFGTNAPSSEFVTVASFIPFFTPAVMFLRIGMANPAAWEVWLSIGVLVVTILFVGWLSAKIYRTGVLLYGKRPSFKEVRKAMQAFRA